MSTIITIEDLSIYSGDTDIEPQRGQMVVDAVNEYIESVTGRSWGEIQTATDQVYDYASVVFLRHQDVQEVTIVKRGRGAGSVITLLPASYYVNNIGRLVLSDYRNNFGVHRDYVSVTYTYGVLTVPADLQLAALALASDFYSYATDGNTAITEAQVGSYRIKVAAGQGSDTGKTSFGIIQRYRTRRV